LNTPTDKELRDWYMGYGVEGRAELAEVEGEAFDRYMVERDARVAKATEQSIVKMLEDFREAEFKRLAHPYSKPMLIEQWGHLEGIDAVIEFINGETK